MEIPIFVDCELNVVDECFIDENPDWFSEHFIREGAKAGKKLSRLIVPRLIDYNNDIRDAREESMFFKRGGEYMHCFFAASKHSKVIILKV